MTTNQKHEIEIPDLPKGWRAVAYRSNNLFVTHWKTVNKSRQPGTNIKEKYYEWIR